MIIHRPTLHVPFMCREGEKDEEEWLGKNKDGRNHSTYQSIQFHPKNETDQLKDIFDQLLLTQLIKNLIIIAEDQGEEC